MIHSIGLSRAMRIRNQESTTGMEQRTSGNARGKHARENMDRDAQPTTVPVASRHYFPDAPPFSALRFCQHTTSCSGITRSVSVYCQESGVTIAVQYLPRRRLVMMMTMTIPPVVVVLRHTSVVYSLDDVLHMRVRLGD